MKIFSKKTFFTSIFCLFSIYCYAFDRPLIINLKAEYTKGSSISLTWATPKKLEKPITKLLVYRDVKPITYFEDINNATFLAQLPGTASGYTDKVSNLNDYFYAVVSFTDECFTLILPGLNATVNGVHVQGVKDKPVPLQKTEKEKNYPSGTLRETPLPYLDLVEGMTASENTISQKAREKAKNLGAKKTSKNEYLEPYFFEEDMISPERGDAYYLFQILSTSFAKQNYPEALKQLQKLTGTNISSEVEKRSIFYMGETYYFTGDFENAVRSFVKVQEYFPEESKKWLESSLDHLNY